MELITFFSPGVNVVTPIKLSRSKLTKDANAFGVMDILVFPKSRTLNEVRLEKLSGNPVICVFARDSTSRVVSCPIELGSSVIGLLLRFKLPILSRPDHSSVDFVVILLLLKSSSSRNFSWNVFWDSFVMPLFVKRSWRSVLPF